MPEASLDARADDLRSAADSSARHVRNVYLTFLSIGIYIAVVIGSTTDQQLLRVSPVTLPLLNVALPIVGFYALVPWLLLLMHFNLLLQFYLLAQKLHALDDVLTLLPDAEARRRHLLRMFPFPFTHMLIGRHHGRLVRFLMGVIVWVSVILLPLILLAWAQIRFLPYHDASITWSQRAVVGLDVAALWFFWPIIVAPHGRLEIWRARWRRRSAAVGALLLLLKHGAIGGGWSRSLRAHRRWRRRQTGRARIGGKPGGSLVGLAFLYLSFFLAVLPDEPIGGLLNPCVRPAEPQAAGLGCVTLTGLLFDEPGAIFHRNLRLAETALLAGAAPPRVVAALWSDDPEIQQEGLEQVVGLDLAMRDLRFADLRNALLSKANLRGANLDGADLRGAELSGSDLRPFDVTEGGSCLQEIQLDTTLDERSWDVWAVAGVTRSIDFEPQFCITSLIGGRLSESRFNGANLPLVRFWVADLTAARLARANLTGSDLEGANFDRASFPAADLRWAVMDGTLLLDASLPGARFEGASLDEVYFVDADLEGAVFDGAIIRKADFTGAKLRGASFKRARLKESWMKGAGLAESDFTEAILLDVDLTGVELTNAKFRAKDVAGLTFESANLAGADLRFLSLRGANLRRADLSGTNLMGARLSGADLSETSLKATNLFGADLQGADLSQATIEGADLSDALLQGADLRDAILIGTFLVGARLQGADLSVRYLFGVDLRGAALAGADFTGVGEFAAINLKGVDYTPLLEVFHDSLQDLIEKFVADPGRRDEINARFARARRSGDRLDERIHSMARCDMDGCMSARDFFPLYASHLGNASVCSDHAAAEIFLRHFDLERGDAPEDVAYKVAVAETLLEMGCDPLGRLSSNLEFWRGQIAGASAD